MYDLAVPNEKPGACAKCRGSGRYAWGAMVNGRMQHEGTCFSCRGTGRQDRSDMGRNRTYNRYKIARIMSGDH
jgi:DnaJ-class molecular chaperone